jgi:hypothetical protein
MLLTRADHWCDIKTLLAQALEQPHEQQARWIAQASNGNAALHAELASLLYAA